MTDHGLGAIPSWYKDIFPSGPHDGFFHRLGTHSVVFVDRGTDQLVVTFDNGADGDSDRYDRDAWGATFCKDRGFSHLGVMTETANWYRDATLITFFEKLKSDGYFNRFKSVAFIGASMGGFAALSFAAMAPGATVLAFSPQSTLAPDLVPWEDRFPDGMSQDWTLPGHDVADHLDQLGTVYLVYDPLTKPDRQHVNRLQSANVIRIKGIGLGQKSAILLQRMDVLNKIMAGAISGKLTQKTFQTVFEGRKTIYLYRKTIEQHLKARNKSETLNRFRRAFRKGRQAEKLAAADTIAAEVDRNRAKPPAVPMAQVFANPDPATVYPPALLHDPQPRAPGNAWMVTQRADGRLSYLSDRWEGRVMGYDEYRGKTYVQAPELVIGMVAVGDDVMPGREGPKRYDWHVLDTDLSRDAAPSKARTLADLHLSILDQDRIGLPWIIACPVSQPSSVPADFEPDSDLQNQLAQKLSAATQACEDLGKTLFVDRVTLSALKGAPDLDEDAAHKVYAQAAKDLQATVTAATGQGAVPLIVVSQSAGSQTDGTSQTILAEARLEIENPLAGFLVVTPCYPYPMIKDAPFTHNSKAAAVIDMLETLAVQEVQAGRPWYCPALEGAELEGKVIKAQFSAMSDLVLDDAAHGFTLANVSKSLKIVAAMVEDKTVSLTLSRAPKPTEDITLNYAFGQTLGKGRSRAANAGSLRDSFAIQSPWDAKITLHRYALSGQVNVKRSKT